MHMRTMTRRLALASGLAAALALPAAASAGPLDHPGATKTVVCAACHGQGGNSQSSAMPIIAGMDAGYFKKQIENYATGKRVSAEMEPYAKQVREVGLDDVAAYFAAQKREPTPVKADPAGVTRGKTAAAACVICHGDNGRGDLAKGIPSIAGQAPGFLAEQMTLFKQDRRNPGDATLAAVKALMKTIPDATFADLAAYYSSLR